MRPRALMKIWCVNSSKCSRSALVPHHDFSTEAPSAIVARIKEATESFDGEDLFNSAKVLANRVADGAYRTTCKRLFGLIKVHAPAHLTETAKLFALNRSPFEGPYLHLLSELDRTAVIAQGLADFVANRHEAEQLLRIAIRALSPDTTAKLCLHYRRARILSQLGDEGSLARHVLELAGVGEDSRFDLDIARTAKLLPLRQHPMLRELLVKAYNRHSEEPEVLSAWVRHLQLNRGLHTAPMETLRTVLLAHPGNQTVYRAWLLAASQCGQLDEVAEARVSLATSSEDRAEWRRAAQTFLAIGRDTEAADCFRRSRLRLQSSDLSRLGACLKRLADATSAEYFLDDESSSTTRQQLKQSLSESEVELSEALNASHMCTSDELVSAALKLLKMHAYPINVLAQAPRQYSYVEPFDARFGRVDLMAYAIIATALLSHAVLLLSQALHLMCLGGRPGGLNVPRQCIEALTESLLRQGRTDEVGRWLALIEGAGWPKQIVAQLHARILGHEGKVIDAERHLKRNAAELVAIHPVEDLSGWLLREGLNHASSDEAAVQFQGNVEHAHQDGTVRVVTLHFTPLPMKVVEAPGLLIRGSELVLGRQGTLLRPPAWYIESWYPDRNDLCRWTTGRAAALTPAKAWIDVSEPVLVLGANDSAGLANYYHFMTHILTRTVWLQRRGWLLRRKLLMPAEMRPWMADALQLAGISREQLLLYKEDENLRLEDVRLLSAFDHPSAHLIREVREQAWRATGIEPDQIADAPERFLFVRRSARSSRLPFDLQALLAIAREEGFECIDPAELPVADQVRLFASANGVAGFSGAGLANLMFCRDGVRSLELTRRETLWPDFDGLALAVGLRHRHCLGWIDTSCMGGQILQDAPARFDLDMLAHQLRWVRRGQ